MTPSALTFFDSFKQFIGDGTIDLDTNTFNVALLTSAAALTSSSGSIFGDISANELPTANGYTAGGQALTTPTFTQTAGTAKWDAADHVWSATGAGLVFRYEVIYAVGTLNGHVNPLVGFRLIDNTPADVTISAGNSLTVQENAGGIFTLS